MVATRRGRHFLYANPGISLGKVSSLKQFGINADVKHGNSIVVAPPSLHEKDRSFAYRWHTCDETVINDLPDFNAAAFRALIERNQPKQPCPRHGAELHNGSRGLDLNKFLASQAPHCGSFDDVLEIARDYNRNLMDRGYPPLDDAEVVKRASRSWEDVKAGKLKPWHNARSVVRTDAAEIKDLCGRSKQHGGDALALLMLLRAEHQGRVNRGETFRLNTKAMSKSQTLPGWTIERFRNAIRVLLAANFIKVAVAGGNTRSGRKATQYTLSSREPVLEPHLGSPR